MTAFTLRPDQAKVKTEINLKWIGGAQFVLAVAATGWGKTVLFSDIVAAEPNASCVIAHRHELVSQISMALARNGVRHRVIGSAELARECTANHMDELGRDYVDPNSKAAVASVDTLIRMDPKDPWFASVRLWVMDEAHHLLKHNKWGNAVKMFINARGLGVTAETERADGYGLGDKNDGIFQEMVEAPTMRDVINMGNLTDYRVFVPPSDLDLTKVDVTPSGDYSPKKLAKATKASHITGDSVKHYLKLAPGKLGILFAVDIEDAVEKAAAFNAAGVPAEVVTSKTPSSLRREIMRKFKARKILMLINVDLFGEGFDLPAIEVVIMCRATQSFNLFKQQFGRALRKMPGKVWAIIIDHVGNVLRHGLPDQIRVQSLGRPVPKAKRPADENVIPMTYCGNCSAGYERIYSCCPHCGHGKLPVSRSAPEYVDGDLHELTQAVLMKMRGEAEAVINTSFIPIPNGVSAIAAAGIRNRHVDRANAQAELRNTLQLWAGHHRDNKKRTDSQIYRLFFLTYGLDMGSAQLLGATEARALDDRLKSVLAKENVVLIQ